MITDVCLCEYTAHGHCGVLREEGAVDNDATLELLARTAVSHARAGADVVAPSDMMDGRVRAIREELDGDGHARDADPRLLGEVRLGLLRAVPRGGRLRARVRRPARLPDGPRQRARGRARGAARRAGGRRHGDGQAGARLRRPDRRGQARDAAARRGLQRQRRVRDGQGRRRGRLPGRARHGARDPHLAAPRGRRHDHHLPRKGRRAMAGRADAERPPARRRARAPRRAEGAQPPGRRRRRRSTTSTAGC